MNRFFIVSVLAVAAVSQSQASTISLFMDPGYVDVASEGTNLQNDLIGLGHTVNSFSGLNVADWDNAFTNGDVVVIAELEIGTLFADLPATTRAAISNQVGMGGLLMTIDSTDPSFDDQTVDLLNGLFGFSLVGQIGTAGGGPISVLNAVDAAGTSFEGGPALLPGSNKVDSVQTSSLPADALNLYHDSANGTTVFCVPYGDGTITHLGFDWFESPTPVDWTSVLDAAVSHSIVPEPTSLTICLVGLMGLANAVRRRRA